MEKIPKRNFQSKVACEQPFPRADEHDHHAEGD